MNVIEVTHGLGLGGAEVALAARLNEAPPEVATTVINTLPKLSSMASELRAVGVVVVDIPIRRLIGPVRLLMWLRRSSGEVVVVHSPTDAVVLLLATALRALSLPVVVVAHSERARWPFRVLLPILNRHAAMHIAVSRKVGASVQCRKARTVSVVYLGASAPPPPRDPTEPRGGLVFLFLGRLVVPKRLDLVLEATRALSTTMRDAGARVVVAGDGPELESAMRFIDECQLDDLVSLKGVVRPVNGLLWASDVLLVPSDYEGLPVSVFEALLCGMQVIATDVGGIREVLEPGGDHRLLPAGDCKALSAEMRRSLGMSAEIRSRREERRLAAENYDVRRLVALFYQCLGSVCDDASLSLGSRGRCSH